MQDNQEKCKELAIRIYNLDEEVYKCVGSSLGRTFTGQKETTLRHLAALMYTKPDGHLLRSELALISNMARTIRDKSERRRLMIEYDSILKEIESLPDTFGQTDIVDKERISLNNLIVRRQNEISENDHLIICISRTQGSAGNDIGFELADNLHINYYEQRAKGGTGLIIVENASVDSPQGSNGTTQLRIDHDNYMPRFFKLCETLHAHGACVGVQLNHAGASAQSKRTNMQPVSASDIPSKAGGEIPRPLKVEEIYEIVKKYGEAAARAQACDLTVLRSMQDILTY